MNQVLLFENNDALRRQCEAALAARGLTVLTAANPAEAEDRLNQHPIDWFVLAESTLETPVSGWIQSLETRPAKPLLLLLANNRDSALAAVRQGANDALAKPFATEDLHLALERAVRLQRQNQILAFQGHGRIEGSATALIGTSGAMQHLGLSIRKLARTQATILIQGPAGSGKSTVARALHAQSHRSHAAFIPVDCTALPSDQLAVRIFGVEKLESDGRGVQTPGLLDLAQGGSLYLDEISRLPDDVQARLESLLQDREFVRVNAAQPIACDVRIVASSCQPLEEAVRNGRFREGLFISLNILPLAIPALRERPEDIPQLAEQFRQRYARQYGLEVRGFSSAALAALQQHAWPGNVAELEHVVARALLSARGASQLEPRHLFPSVDVAATSIPKTPVAEQDVDIEDLGALEKKHILAILAKCDGNRTHTARRLGISIRTLRNKLREYRLAAEASNAEAA